MKKKQLAVSRPTASSLEEQAQALLNAGKYKEAIELYKKLLQDSDNPEWRRQLAHCYLERAVAFAAKAMYKEALVLWENYRQHAQPPYRHYDLYLTWLLQSNNPAKIHASLKQLSAQQLDKEFPSLAAWLGLLVISKHPELQSDLPRDSVFMAHLNSVQTALQAYHENNPAAVDEALKLLPYRSAFRDFRTLLKAVMTAPTAPAEAQALLAKIPLDSPYAQASALLLACGLNGAARARAMMRFNAQQRRLAGGISGLSKQQFDMIEQLSKQPEPMPDKMQFNLVIQYQDLFGLTLTQRFCSAMLTRYPAGQRDFSKAFGRGDKFEQNRLQALRYEHEDNYYDAQYHWKQCLTALAGKEGDHGLKMALILRHIAQWNMPAVEKTRLLIESLEHDPEDHDCYLQILRAYSQQKDKGKDYKQWLTKTLKKFPKDLEVLVEAVQTAARNNDYQKACEYAAKILTIDPLNTFAKQVLFSSRLAHARQLIQAKKYPLAEHEIQQAEALKTGKSALLQTQLLRGLYTYAAEDKQAGLQLIVAALDKLHKDPLTAHLQAAMEAPLTGLPVATLLRELPPAKDYLLAPQDMAHLNHLLGDYAKDDGNRELLHKALEKIKAPLKKSLAQQDYDESLLLALCQTLDAIGHFELLRHCAKLAQAKWNKPIWMYYRVYAETNGDAGQCSYLQKMRLELYLDDARREKDYRAATLICQYLDRYHEAHLLPGMGYLDDLFGAKDEADDDLEPLDRLFGHLPDEIFYKLDKKLAAIAKKISPERLVLDVQQQAGKGRDIFSALMKNPDIFTALLFLKAADELGIDTGVTLEDVFACFKI